MTSDFQQKFEQNLDQDPEQDPEQELEQSTEQDPEQDPQYLLEQYLFFRSIRLLQFYIQFLQMKWKIINISLENLHY